MRVVLGGDVSVQGWTACSCKPCQERLVSAEQCCRDCKWGGDGGCGHEHDARTLDAGRKKHDLRLVGPAPVRPS
jgi:hypothetical protein